MKRQINDINLQKHLTHQELLDYAQDVLGNDEMYRLELHLNECDLCSNAVEGTMLLTNPIKTVEEIQRKILPSQDKRQKVNYLAIAASISLIAVFGLSYWLLNKSEKDQSIAENTGVEQKEILEEVPVLKEAPSNQITKSQEEVIEKDLAIAKTEPLKLNNADKYAAAESEVKKNSVIIKKSEENNPANQVVTNDVVDIEDEFKQENLKQEENNIEPVADVAERNLQTSPSMARSAKKSVAETKAPLEDQKEPVTEGGMSALKEFVNQNLTYPQKAIDNNTKGTVVLEVTILPDGAIKNIVIVKSVGSGCDAEAMRLITVGPKWIPAAVNGIAIEEKRQVKIKFKN